MKRYRILTFDADSRPQLLAPIQEHWAETVKERHHQNQEAIIKGYVQEFGEHAFPAKLQNIIDLGSKPFSILAFHNRFHEQIRRAFVMGAYYPALTAACALGERILNHLLLLLRDDYRTTPEYKRIYRKASFDDWHDAISILESWNVLLPDVTDRYRRFARIRNNAIHFGAETDKNDRQLALQAIAALSSIIKDQFPVIGRKPWFIDGTPGESYIRKDAEDLPFVRKVYLPNCRLAGPNHVIEFEETSAGIRMVPVDDTVYEEREITDEEFKRLRFDGKR